jgi:F420-dependent oxidoreductase-like protein
LRFGIKTAPQHDTFQQMVDCWKAADDIDLFESAWTFDHFYPIFSDWKGPCMEAWVTTTALGMLTKRIRVGVMVTGNVYRHPAVLANMVASADIALGGRLEFGFGAGWNQQECDAYGIDLPPLKERFDRFDEALEVIHLLLTQETSDFKGKYYTLTEARCEPKPVQSPRPPFVIGGSGPKRTLRAVARWADHWNFPGGGAQVLTPLRETLNKHCADIGRDPSEITISTHLRYAGVDQLGAMVDEAAALGEAGLTLGIVYIPPPHAPSDVEKIAEALQQLA